MSEDYEASIQALKEKNAQLLDEKRKVKAQLEEAAQQLEAVTAERDHSMAELKRITVEQPRAELIESMCVPGMADTAAREINHKFTITDDGDIQNLEGEPVEVDGQPLKYDADGIMALYKSGLCPALGHMLKGRDSSGGGARGGHSSGEIHQMKTEQKAAPRKFGLGA